MNATTLELSQLSTLSDDVVLSSDPNRAIQEMMTVINHIRDVYQEETAALEQADTKRFLELQPLKMKYARRYQSGASQILTRNAEFSGVNAKLKADLEAMRADFSALVTRNMQAIERMQRGLKRLTGHLMDAARKSASENMMPSYGASGHLNKTDNKRLSIGINAKA